MYSNYVDILSSRLKKMEVTYSEGTLSLDAGLFRWQEWTSSLQQAGGVLYMVGNGASATMASHISLDATKNGGLKAQAFNDIASLTALGNDLGYEEVFAFPISRYAQLGDMLLTISSSGNSPSIIRAIEAAHELGMKVITLSAMNPENKSRRMGDLNFFIPVTTYGLAECAHQILLHYWLDAHITNSVGSANACFCLPEG